MQLVASIAEHHAVPVLMHFQHETYNLGFERFHKLLEKFPKVNFIGHAQTFWGNIDKNHLQPVMYPKGPVTPGGITGPAAGGLPQRIRRSLRRLGFECAVTRRRPCAGVSQTASGQVDLRKRLQRIAMAQGKPVAAFRLAAVGGHSPAGARRSGGAQDAVVECGAGDEDLILWGNSRATVMILVPQWTASAERERRLSAEA